MTSAAPHSVLGASPRYTTSGHHLRPPPKTTTSAHHLRPPPQATTYGDMRPAGQMEGAGGCGERGWGGRWMGLAGGAVVVETRGRPGPGQTGYPPPSLLPLSRTTTLNPLPFLTHSFSSSMTSLHAHPPAPQLFAPFRLISL